MPSPQQLPDPELPIGVFDSGVGGLTVLRAMRAHLPNESFVYLGDTARLPYGTKSPKTVQKYALQAAQVLVDRGIKLLVVACNTASAVSVPALREKFGPLPLTGVVEPGAEAATRASKTGHIAVIGTQSTIAGGAYERAVRRRRPDATVVGRACPLFVALAEEGWVEGAVPEAVAQRYLAPLRQGPDQIDCLLLGCTHFPVLRDPIERVVGPDVKIVDSAQTTAVTVAAMLDTAAVRRSQDAQNPGSIQLLATDDPQRFARVGAGFLGGQLSPQGVELVDL